MIIDTVKYVPEWFPGAGFKRKAREWNKLRIKMTEDPYRVTKERMARLLHCSLSHYFVDLYF